jgi:glycosyltransferase involved in cell wall biosynthesis
MNLSVAYFGTYDAEYPRNAVLLTGLRSAGVDVIEFNAPLPQGLTANTMATPAGASRVAQELVRAHLALALQHRRELRFDALVVGYPGHFVVPFAAAVAKLRRAKLIFDPLVSLADTFAGDRGLIDSQSASAQALQASDRLAFSLPDLVLADTAAHAKYYREAIGVPAERLAVVPVGALPEATADGSARDLGDAPMTVFQYGKWSPLHGADTTLAAAEFLRGAPIRFVLAGEGQLSGQLRAQIVERGLTNVEWLGMIPPFELRARTLAADVCLGVFGASDKAGRVVPNKIYDALACGRPVVTRDSDAAEELLAAGGAALLVPPAEGTILAITLQRLLERSERARLGAAALELYRARFTPPAIADSLLAGFEAIA